MRPPLLLVAILIVPLAGFVRADLIVKSGEKVAFMGDSITFQGWDNSGGYVKLTVAGLDKLGAKIVPIPAGVGGNTSRDMLARLNSDVLSKKPDWLTLSCGVNDVWRHADGVSLEDYKKNITSIVDQAQAAGIKVVIMTATVINENLSMDDNQKLIPYNDFLRQLAAARHLPLADENAAFRSALVGHDVHPPYLTEDGVHPNSSGSQLMAQTLLGAFGASPAQLDEARQAWMTMPDGAFAYSGFGFSVNQPITIAQFNALQAVAAAHNESVQTLCDSLLFTAFGDSIKAHQNDTTFNDGAIKTDAQKEFATRVAELTH
jgi:lysophospholipase L1-like esterase